MRDGERLLIAGICIFILGTSLDHLSTQYGLSLVNIIETNPTVCTLRERGIWSLVEIFTLVGGVLGGAMVLKIQRGDRYGIHSIYMAVGTYRLIAAFSNLMVISQIL